MHAHPALSLSSRRPRPAFTLIELLTVIAIIGILAAIIIPVVGRVRDAARAAQCLSNLRHIGTAARLYSEDNRGMTPPLNYNFPKTLWPYAHTPKPIEIAGNDLPADLAGSVFECPKAHADSAPEVTTKRSYGVNLSLVPSIPPAEKETKGVPLSRVQVPSQAVFFGDVKNASILRPNSCHARHSSRMNVVFVDGHAAAVALTEEITNPPSGWITTPFWLGEHR